MVLMLCISQASAQQADLAPQLPAIAPVPDFGASTHLAWDTRGWSYQKLLPIARQVGFGFVRDTISWGGTEKQKGVYALDTKDEVWINAAFAANINVIPCLVYGNKLYENELDPEGFSRFAAWMAEKYKSDKRILAFEIWNEPNNFGFKQKYGGEWNGKGDSPWLGKFAELVQITAKAIKAVDPDRIVITGGGNPPASGHMITQYPKAFEHIDGLTMHPYSLRLPPESVPYGGESINKRDGIKVAGDDHGLESLWATIQSLCNEHLGRKLPIWVTEVGFSTYDHSRKSSIFAGFSDESQATYLLRSTIMAKASSAIACWTIYDLMNDGGDRYETENNFGMVRHLNQGLEPKPVFFAMRRLMEMLGPDAQKLPYSLARLECKLKPMGENDGWQIMPKEPFVKIQKPFTYWFKVNEGYLGFLWMGGRLNHEHQPPLGSLLLTGLDAQVTVSLTNVSTGQVIDTAQHVRRNGSDMTIANLPLLAEPIAIRLQTQSHIEPYKPLVGGDVIPLPVSDDGGAWSFTNGPEFKGATGKMVVGNADKPLALTYDFTGGGLHVAAIKRLEPHQPVAKLIFDIDGTINALMIRIQDQTDQVFQYNVGLYTPGKPVELDLENTKPQTTWGGAKDRVIHQPVRSVWLMATKSNQAPLTGSLSLKTLKAIAASVE